MSSAASAPDASSASLPPLRLYVHSVLNPNFPAWPEVTWAVRVAAGDVSPTLRKLKQLFKEELMRKTNMDKVRSKDCREPVRGCPLMDAKRVLLMPTVCRTCSSSR